MSDFLMPSLGADMDAGTLVEWLVKPGDTVHHGDIVAVVETDKGAIEIEIFEDGTVQSLDVPVGTKVPVGTVLAKIDGAGKARTPKEKPAEAKPEAEAPPPPPKAPKKPAAKPAAPPSPTGHVRASPAARKHAQELGVDLASLTGTGPEGAITFKDVDQAKPARKAPAPGGFKQADMRKAIATAMARSNREIPHYYASLDIEMTALTEWLTAENEKRSVVDRVLLLAPVLKAVALALKDVPELNGQWEGEAFKPISDIHMGVAVALRGGGLIAPAIHGLEKLDLSEIMAKLRDLTNRARKGGLRSSELSDPTFTVTSLGEDSADSVSPIIFPPQAAILGLGAIRQRPWVHDDGLVVRPIVTTTLGADHRVSDGRTGGRFLHLLAEYLQEPTKL
jgi:pyruvate dehydrogenase E2 component (dihydrolipoamide acetyltransferase)